MQGGTTLRNAQILTSIFFRLSLNQSRTALAVGRQPFKKCGP